MDVFIEQYAIYREVFGAKFKVVECNQSFDMPEVVIGAVLTNYDNKDENFVVRGKEPKKYVPEYKPERECSVQYPIYWNEVVVSTTTEIPFANEGMGQWKRFVREDVCNLAMADFLLDQED